MSLLYHEREETACLPHRDQAADYLQSVLQREIFRVPSGHDEDDLVSRTEGGPRIKVAGGRHRGYPQIPQAVSCRLDAWEAVVRALTAATPTNQAASNVARNAENKILLMRKQLTSMRIRVAHRDWWASRSVVSVMRRGMV